MLSDHSFIYPHRMMSTSDDDNRERDTKEREIKCWKTQARSKEIWITKGLIIISIDEIKDTHSLYIYLSSSFVHIYTVFGPLNGVFLVVWDCVMMNWTDYPKMWVKWKRNSINLIERLLHLIN